MEAAFETQPAYTLAAAREYCRRYTRSHSENFSVATLFLPRRLLPHFHAVYSFCRWSDDLGDETGGGERALALLAEWRAELLRCYEGTPRHPITIALADTIRRFHIPSQSFTDLISAFEQDQTVKQYETYVQLHDYCRRSANPVGRILLHLFECFDESNAALSDHICTALQLTNFWQDVARDHAIGRIYLPAEDRRHFGYADADLAAETYNAAFVALMRFEVGRARALFDRGVALVARVPGEVRIDVELFARGGLAVLRKIETLQYNVWRRRPRLAKLEKAALVGRALWKHRGVRGSEFGVREK
jgi:squalene synthase HpnC